MQHSSANSGVETVSWLLSEGEAQGEGIFS